MMDDAAVGASLLLASRASPSWDVVLSNGVRMPRCGFGTANLAGEQCVDAVSAALRVSTNLTLALSMALFLAVLLLTSLGWSVTRDALTRFAEQHPVFPSGHTTTAFHSATTHDSPRINSSFLSSVDREARVPNAPRNDELERPGRRVMLTHDAGVQLSPRHKELCAAHLAPEDPPHGRGAAAPAAPRVPGSGPRRHGPVPRFLETGPGSGSLSAREECRAAVAAVRSPGSEDFGAPLAFFILAGSCFARRALRKYCEPGSLRKWARAAGRSGAS